MGEIEKKVRRDRRKVNVQRIILGTILTAGLLSVALLAPNALQIMRPFYRNKKKNPKFTLNNAINRLIKKGFIKYVKKDSKKYFCVTDKGKKALRFLELENFKISKPRRWDGKWRLIVFDILEKRKGTRDLLRKCLVKIGFIRLQNSVWVYPYDCEDLIFLLKTDFELGKNVLYIVADEIESDKNLKENFGL